MHLFVPPFGSTRERNKAKEMQTVCMIMCGSMCVCAHHCVCCVHVICVPPSWKHQGRQYTAAGMSICTMSSVCCACIIIYMYIQLCNYY